MIRHLSHSTGPWTAPGPDPSSWDCNHLQTTSREPDVCAGRGCLNHPDLLFWNAVSLTPRNVCRSAAGVLPRI
ncbi:MAG: hypothetical protein ACFFD2_09820 [Promethearchaeota archaeon]